MRFGGFHLAGFCRKPNSSHAPLPHLNPVPLPLPKQDAYRVCPSEGAHSGFAPRGWKQLMLCRHVERELGHVDVEHVSGGQLLC